MIFLAAPYTGTPEEITSRMKLFCKIDGALMNAGIFTVAAIYKHLLFTNGVQLPSSWDYWSKYSIDLIDRCDAVVVVCMDGWGESVGTQSELGHALTTGKKVLYLTHLDDMERSVSFIKENITNPITR